MKTRNTCKTLTISLTKSPKILINPKNNSDGFQKGGILILDLTGLGALGLGTTGWPGAGAGGVAVGGTVPLP